MIEKTREEVQHAKFVKLDMESLRKHADGLDPEAAEAYADERLLAYAAEAMRRKMEEARRKGRGGWWMEECSIDYLRRLLQEHVERGDMIDVLNLASMIYAREGDT